MLPRKEYNEINWQSFFYYDSSSPSFLRWRHNGKKAGWLCNTTGYYSVGFNKSSFLIHRIIWVMFRGEIDTEKEKIYIDHLDGDRGNNDIDNLRLVTKSENSRNKVRHQGEYPFGICLISIEKKTKTYRAFRVRVMDKEGNRMDKVFSIEKYGRELALQKATEHLALFRKLVGNYTERHGENYEK